MRVRIALFAVALICLGLAGPQALGRLALLAGFPGIAATLLTDPAERGIAMYRAGDHAAADAAFAVSRKRQTYNRALSLAAIGDFPLSVAYFDAVLYDNPSDAEARRNRALVAALDPDVTADSMVPGRIIGTGGLAPAPTTAIVTAGATEPSARRPITARGIAANYDWLQTLPDDPGEFLALRLRAEHERRGSLGMLRPARIEPW